MKSKCILTAAILMAFLSSGLMAQGPSTGSGQAYPAKPVRIVVPFAPGGNVDLVARGVGQRLSEGLGQQVIIDNRPGSSALLGTHLVAKSAPASSNNVTSDRFSIHESRITNHAVPIEPCR